MLHLAVKNRQGLESVVECPPEGNLMEALRDAGYEELAAVCGGFCSCATCHVYVEADSAYGLMPMGSDEDGMLDGSLHRRKASRLACQVQLSAALDGLKVAIAPEE